MKKGTKKIIINILDKEKRSLLRSIDYCKNKDESDPHIQKLERKIAEIDNSIIELESC